MSDLYALLIGVDFYFGQTLPDGSFYPRLGGCVRDIRHVESYLTDPARLNLPRQNLLMLTATDTGAAAPAEAPADWPTYENMVAKFQHLTAMAQAGDQVYIHYSGHGGRASTIYPGLKGDSGLDEALVPLDIGDPNARYLRDVELYYLINEMVQKKVRVVVVFDSCHSGGATRGKGGARKRGISRVDTTVRPTESLVAAPTQLSAAWQEATGGMARASKPASGWLLEPKGYTFFAACRANESAFEYPFNDNESNGALTYWLLDSLRQAGAISTYKMLHDRILAKVHGQFAEQTPLLQGEGDWQIFGSERIPPVYAVAVLEIDETQNRLRLAAGAAHGLEAGAQFAIYPSGTSDFNSTSNRIALVEVNQVNDVDSWAKILAQSGERSLEAGAQALQLQSANLRIQRDVAIAIDDPDLRRQIAAAISAQGNGFVTNAGDEKCDFQVAINVEKNYEIWDATGALLPNLTPAINVNEPDALEQLVKRLIHLAKYFNVRDLSAPGGKTNQKLEVILHAQADEAAAASGSAPIYQAGDKIKLVVRNSQGEGEADDPARILNITVLDLAPDWSITQIYPAGAAAFEALDPQASIELDFTATLPAGKASGTDTLKVFATQNTTNFRWLELPVPGQPSQRGKIKRGAKMSVLESILASVTDETAIKRNVQLTGAASAATWTVKQVELRVVE
jgi:hypothetical protein